MVRLPQHMRALVVVFPRADDWMALIPFKEEVYHFLECLCVLFVDSIHVWQRE